MELFHGFAGVVYNAYIERERVAAVVGRLLWGSDLQPLFRALDCALAAHPGVRILDVPAGGGLVVAYAGCKLGHRLVAVDAEPTMLTRYAARARAAGLEATTVQADVHAMPFATWEFDLVLAVNSLHCFAHPLLALSEIVRCARSQVLLTCFVRGRRRRSDVFMRWLAGSGGFGPGLTAAELRAWVRAEPGVVLDGWSEDGALVVAQLRRSGND